MHGALCANHISSIASCLMSGWLTAMPALKRSIRSYSVKKRWTGSNSLDRVHQSRRRELLSMATRLAILARGRSRTRFLIICFILNNTCDELGSEVNAKAALEDIICINWDWVSAFILLVSAFILSISTCWERIAVRLSLDDSNFLFSSSNLILSSFFYCTKGICEHSSPYYWSLTSCAAHRVFR